MAPDELSKSIKNRWNDAMGKELYAIFSYHVSKSHFFSAKRMS